MVQIFVPAIGIDRVYGRRYPLGLSIGWAWVSEVVVMETVRWAGENGAFGGMEMWYLGATHGMGAEIRKCRY
jgi:phage FluMu gp28-like protein